MSNDGLIKENMDLSHIHLAVCLEPVTNQKVLDSFQLLHRVYQLFH
jgi:hypothetical protein